MDSIAGSIFILTSVLGVFGFLIATNLMEIVTILHQIHKHQKGQQDDE